MEGHVPLACSLIYRKTGSIIIDDGACRYPVCLIFQKCKRAGRSAKFGVSAAPGRKLKRLAYALHPFKMIST